MLTRKVSRAHQKVSRANQKVSRAHQIVSRAHQIVSRAHEKCFSCSRETKVLFYFHHIPLQAPDVKTDFGQVERQFVLCVKSRDAFLMQTVVSEELNHLFSAAVTAHTDPSPLASTIVVTQKKTGRI